MPPADLDHMSTIYSCGSWRDSECSASATPEGGSSCSLRESEWMGGIPGSVELGAPEWVDAASDDSSSQLDETEWADAMLDIEDGSISRSDSATIRNGAGFSVSDWV